MSMSVSRQKSTKRTNIKHNNRTDKKLPDSIDRSRSDLNNYLVQKNIREFYKDGFGEALEKYNTKQKRSDRKIKNYYNHILASKKTAT